MKRKIFIIGIIIVLTLIMALSFVACSHNHKWETSWQSDETYHWHICTKKNCDELGSKAEHNFVIEHDDNNHWEKCATCGYKKENVAHTNIVKYNDVYHWDGCTICEIVKNKTTHKIFGGACNNCEFIEGSEGLVYSLNSNGNSYKVVGIENHYEGNYSNIIIAEYYNEKPVTTIAEGAFQNRKLIKSVEIPKSILTIEDRAFAGCDALSEIIIPVSVTSIGNNVFNDCYGITIKAEAEYAPNGWNTSDWEINQFCKYPIVWNCRNNNVADDGYEYFLSSYYGCTIKYGFKDGEVIVAKQPRLSSSFNFVFPAAGVTYNQVTYDITGIADYAFYGYEGLVSVEISRFIKNIGDYAFAGCIDLNNINWLSNGDNIESIGIGAFSDCRSLQSIILPKNLKEISAGIVQNCINLSEITILANVTSIEESAFAGCTKLTKIKFAGSEADWQAIEKGENWDTQTGEYIIEYNYI